MCWFVYLVRCSDNSLYAGIAKDVERRVNEHNSSNKLGAKYTKARRPVELVYQENADSRSDASKKEHKLRTLSKPEKEKLVSSFKS
jgi:putative endonuclease